MRRERREKRKQTTGLSAQKGTFSMSESHHMAMIDCIREIEVVRQQERKYGSLLGLDAPNGEDVPSFIETIPVEGHVMPPHDPHTASGALYLAIQALPEKQRLVMVYHYGIGCAPEPLNVISRRFFPKSPRNAHYHHRRALASLERALGPGFPAAMHAIRGAQ
jgi:hypothetical protein